MPSIVVRTVCLFVCSKDALRRVENQNMRFAWRRVLSSKLSFRISFSYPRNDDPSPDISSTLQSIPSSSRSYQSHSCASVLSTCQLTVCIPLNKSQNTHSLNYKPLGSFILYIQYPSRRALFHTRIDLSSTHSPPCVCMGNEYTFRLDRQSGRGRVFLDGDGE